MTGCEVVYFRTERGDAPVEQFIRRLDLSTRRRYWRRIEYLQQLGKFLHQPHSKALGNGIYELRFRGADGHYRILYFFFAGQYAVLTNGFLKKTGKTPKQELALAISRMNIFTETPEGHGLNHKEIR